MDTDVLVIGYKPTNSNKAYLIEVFRAAVQRLDAKVNDHNLLDEMTTFISERNGMTTYFTAVTGKNDDCVIAAALAWFGHSQLPPIREIAVASVDIRNSEQIVADDVWRALRKAQEAGNRERYDRHLGRLR